MLWRCGDAMAMAMAGSCEGEACILYFSLKQKQIN
jgi:hypothetical protein